MDVLSEVLRTVRLRGAVFFNGEFSAPWCFRSAASAEAAPSLFPLLGASQPGAGESGRLVIFHFLTEGRAYAHLSAGEHEPLSAGDIVIIPHGDVHFLGNGSPEKPVDSFVVFADHLAKGLKAARYGGGGEITRFVCGFMACEPRLSDVFLAGLPPILKVHIAHEPSGQWLAHSIRFSVDQAGESSAGSSLVLSRLAEILFVEALRRYVNTMPAAQTGWLAGARDAVAGRAMAGIHKEPAAPWTIAKLARSVGVSRTVLVERFRHFLGESPMAYLSRWRLKLGAEMLEGGEVTVAEVALAVGYSSEAAFNRAFKREFDCPPAQFRRRHRSGPAQATSA
ncbi:MAG TPA: AraC family transcriptional regulator [Bryobacteraceae bacterium]|nr:AraC family transcriptional regulator [Bryobacteraceae bacterium]